MRLSNSASSERLLVMVEPRYVKCSVTSSSSLSMRIAGGEGTSWPMTLVFLMLIVSPNSLHAWENLSISRWRSPLVSELRAASSANSISLMRTVRTLVFALSRARLNSFPSLLVCKWTPSVDCSNANFSSREKNILNKVGARTQPCFMPLCMGKGSEASPS